MENKYKQDKLELIEMLDINIKEFYSNHKNKTIKRRENDLYFIELFIKNYYNQHIKQ